MRNVLINPHQFITDPRQLTHDKRQFTRDPRWLDTPYYIMG